MRIIVVRKNIGTTITSCQLFVVGDKLEDVPVEINPTHIVGVVEVTQDVVELLKCLRRAFRLKQDGDVLQRYTDTLSRCGETLGFSIRADRKSLDAFIDRMRTAYSSGSGEKSDLAIGCSESR